ncbi:hypothetical protein [Chryseobacterium sp. ERMR1:04]|uniref:hypothetical protein n=1 Tax=Chryseobacterium sp. ERMR1:04 TaxID=1705393 RepID=UPI0006C89F85|nr:hypothetical protein [Chryseobacterium sp. ERMR1:04]
MNEEYKLTIFRQSRIITCVFTLPIFLFIALIIGVEIHSITISLIFLAMILFLMYYFSVGHLNIAVDKNAVALTWKKKLIFNYKPISKIEFRDIKVIILDDNQFLRKIKTDKNTIYINNSKIKSKDAEKFISRLKNEIKLYDIKVLDSWQEFSEKGYLRKAYLINSFLTIILMIVFITLTIFKGFQPYSLSIFILIIPQIILYNKQMKR